MVSWGRAWSTENRTRVEALDFISGAIGDRESVIHTPKGGLSGHALARKLGPSRDAISRIAPSFVCWGHHETKAACNSGLHATFQSSTTLDYSADLSEILDGFDRSRRKD